MLPAPKHERHGDDPDHIGVDVAELFEEMEPPPTTRLLSMTCSNGQCSRRQSSTYDPDFCSLGKPAFLGGCGACTLVEHFSVSA